MVEFSNKTTWQTPRPKYKNDSNSIQTDNFESQIAYYGLI